MVIACTQALIRINIQRPILLLLFYLQNNGKYIIAVHISPQGMIITSAHNNSIMGIVTLLLPSAEPQIFENTIQLYSTDGGRNVSCIHKKISVPGPWLNEYQEGPGIEKPIRKLRPKGQYHWCSRFKTRLIKSKIWRITLYQKAHITQPFWNPCVDSRQSYSDKVHGASPLRPNAAIEAKIWVFKPCSMLFQIFILLMLWSYLKSQVCGPIWWGRISCVVFSA